MDKYFGKNWQENVSLKDYTTFKVGGLARYFIKVKSEDELLEAIENAQAIDCPVFILGGGSNLLVSDKGFSGLVIQMDIEFIKWEDQKIHVGAGTALNKLVIESVKRGLSGFEWEAVIPGTIGGAICGNAGTPEHNIGHLVEEVRFFDCDKMDFKSYVNDECNFEYRDSIFRHQGDKVITSVVLSQHHGDAEIVLNNLRDLIRKKVATQPRSYPSAGCIFKNPEGQSAGALIDQAGFKGRRIGNAQISEKHANFIVNLGGAKSEEIIALIELIKSCIHREFGLNLTEEIIYLPR